MVDTLMRYKVEYDGKLYVLEAPEGTSNEALVAAIKKAKPETENRTFNVNPPDTQFDGKPPVLEDDVTVDLPNVPAPTEVDSSDPDFDPSAGTKLNLATEEPSEPAVDASLGQANLANRARAAGTGALFGYEDELEGMYKTYRPDKPSFSVQLPFGMSANFGMPWGEDYTRERDKVRDDFGLYQQRNPWESTGLEVAGGLTSMMIPGASGALTLGRTAKLASPFRQAALTGFGAGALSGAGSADEVEDIPFSALKYGTLGTIVSPLAMLGAKGGAETGRWVASRFSPSRLTPEENAAGDVLHSALRRRGLTPDDLVTKIGEDRRLGVPAMIGDYLPGNADAALRVPSTGRDAHLSDLFDRQIGARERTQSQLNDAFGNPQEYYDTEEKLLDAGRRRASSVYDAAYAVGDVRDPRLISMLQGPSMRKFWTRAKAIADLDAEAAVARGEDPGPYLLKPLFKEVTDADGNLIRLERTDAVPDVRTLDYIKKGMGDEIDSLFKGTSSAGKQQAASLKELYRAFVDRVDEVVPEYKAARAVYAGDLEVREALEKGRNLAKMVPAQVKRELKDASAGEIDAFRTGAYEGVRALVNSPTTNRNWGKVFSMPGNLRDNLKAVLPPAEFDLLQTIFKREGEIFATSGSRMANSLTIDRSEGIADIDRVIQGSGIVGDVRALASTGGRISRILDFLSSKFTDAEKRERVYTLLNKVYRAGEPDDIMEALSLINTTKATSSTATAIEEAVAPRLSGATGSAFARDPAPVRDAEAEIAGSFAPIEDTTEEAEPAPAAEGGPTPGVPFSIPQTGIPEVDAVIPRLITQESSGNHSAVSDKGAEGLMQIMPETQRKPGFGLEPLKDASAEENLRLGTQYMAALYQHYGNDMTLALMAYNWGPKNVDAWLQGGKKVAVPDETKKYVRAIIGAEIQ